MLWGEKSLPACTPKTWTQQEGLNGLSSPSSGQSTPSQCCSAGCVHPHICVGKWETSSSAQLHLCLRFCSLTPRNGTPPIYFFFPFPQMILRDVLFLFRSPWESRLAFREQQNCSDLTSAPEIRGQLGIAVLIPCARKEWENLEEMPPLFGPPP